MLQNSYIVPAKIKFKHLYLGGKIYKIASPSRFAIWAQNAV